MGIKTEDMCRNLPPKTITEGIDWLRILDEFDPTKQDRRGRPESFFLQSCQTGIDQTVGSKGAHEYNNREYERLGETGRKLQAEAYRKWERELEETRRVEE